VINNQIIVQLPGREREIGNAKPLLSALKGLMNIAMVRTVKGKLVPMKKVVPGWVMLILFRKERLTHGWKHYSPRFHTGEALTSQ
jgi:hypothetical protein